MEVFDDTKVMIQDISFHVDCIINQTDSKSKRTVNKSLVQAQLDDQASWK